jgi:hypothetical protein
MHMHNRRQPTCTQASRAAERTAGRQTNRRYNKQKGGLYLFLCFVFVVCKRVVPLLHTPRVKPLDC